MKIIKNSQQFLEAVKVAAGDESLKKYLCLEDVNYCDIELALLRRRRVLIDFGYAEPFDLSVDEISKFIEEIKEEEEINEYHEGI